MPIMDNIANQNLLMRIRSNHALEHATLHILQEKGINIQLGGISDMSGFWIYGDVSTDMVLATAQEALARLIGGENELAVHPNCGTNIAVGSLAAGGLAWMGMLGTRGRFGRKLRRLPLAVLLALVGYQLSRPLGPKLQKQITTNANLEGLEVAEVVKHDVFGRTVHYVSTRSVAKS